MPLLILCLLVFKPVPLPYQKVRGPLIKHQLNCFILTYLLIASSFPLQSFYFDMVGLNLSLLKKARTTQPISEDVHVFFLEENCAIDILTCVEQHWTRPILHTKVLLCQGMQRRLLIFGDVYYTLCKTG